VAIPLEEGCPQGWGRPASLGGGGLVVGEWLNLERERGREQEGQFIVEQREGWGREGGGGGPTW